MLRNLSFVAVGVFLELGNLRTRPFTKEFSGSPFRETEEGRRVKADECREQRQPSIAREGKTEKKWPKASNLKEADSRERGGFLIGSLGTLDSCG